MEKYKFILGNLFISMLLTFIILLPDVIFSHLNQNYNFEIEFKDIIAVLFVMIIITFYSKKIISFIIALFLVLIFLQISNFNFFGSLVDPHGIILVFLEIDEIFETLNETKVIFIYPIVSIIPSFIMLYLYLKLTSIKTIQKSCFRYLFIILLAFLPIKASFSTSSEKFMPKNDSFSLRNILYSSSYFIGKDLWSNLYSNKKLKEFKPYEVINTQKVNRTIVLVMGESLTYKHMNLYGYSRETTPNLNVFKNEENFRYFKAISSAVYTKVSLPMFFNLQREPENYAHTLGKTSNLFKLAKLNGFNTYFYSKQKLKLISNSLSMSDIDSFKSVKDFPSNSLDDILVNELEEIDFTKNNFIVLHQRATHTPYEYNYTKDFEKFTYNKDNYHEYMNNSYDNSVLFTDNFLSRVIKKLKNKSLDNEVLFYFTPDHGEMLGDNGKYGHSKLDINCALVPFIYYQINSDFDRNFTNKEFYSHYDIGKLIALSLGYIVKNENDDGSIYLNGTGIMGEAGYLNFTKSEILNKL